MYNKKQAANNKAATKDTTKRGASQNSADTTGINQDLTRSCLERICAHFRISVKKDKKDEQLSTSEMLDMLQSKVKSLKRKLPSNYFDQSRRLLKRSAQTPEDLTILADISQAMRLDYDVRRAMLLKRLDVTIQSFLWSDKVVGQEDDLLNAIDPLIEQLKETRPAINPKKIFEATPSLREEQEIRVTEASLSSSVKGVIIGSVPDRGGRANEVSTDHLCISFIHLLTKNFAFHSYFTDATEYERHYAWLECQKQQKRFTNGIQR
jgi:hypothetical protein